MTTSARPRIAITAALFLTLLAGVACNNVPTSPGTSSGWTFADSKRGQLADYKGKVVLLNFYATWCEPCRVETPHLVELQQLYGEKGLQTIGLNVGGDDDHQYVPEFAREFGVQFPLAIPDDEFVDAYLGINQNIPQTFVLDRQGKTVKHSVGYSDASKEELERVIKATLAQ